MLYRRLVILLVLFTLLNLVYWRVILGDHSFPNLFFQAKAWFHFLDIPAYFVGSFIILANLFGPLRFKSTRSINRTWQRFEDKILIADLLAIGLSTAFVFDLYWYRGFCFPFYTTWAYTFLFMHDLEEDDINRSGYEWDYVDLVSLQGLDYIWMIRDVKWEEDKRHWVLSMAEEEGLLYEDEDYTPYSEDDFHAEVSSDRPKWWEICIHDKHRKKYRWLRGLARLYPPLRNFYNRWDSKTDQWAYDSYSEKVFHTYYDKKKHQTKDYYSTFRTYGVFELRRNIFWNLLEWPAREPAHIQSQRYLWDKEGKPVLYTENFDPNILGRMEEGHAKKLYAMRIKGHHHVNEEFWFRPPHDYKSEKRVVRENEKESKRIDQLITKGIYNPSIFDNTAEDWWRIIQGRQALVDKTNPYKREDYRKKWYS